MNSKKIVKLLKDNQLSCFLIPSKFTHAECDQFLQKYVPNGFKKAIDNYPTYYRNNERFVIDNQALSQTLFSSIKSYLPQTISQLPCRSSSSLPLLWHVDSLNSRIRFCKYNPSQYFSKHLDGVHYQQKNKKSILTFMIYLNSHGIDFQGGRTLFYKNKIDNEIIAEYLPKKGDLIIFDHRIWHEGEIVRKGEKFVMRSDIVYQRDDAKVQGKEKQASFQHGHLGYIWALCCWNEQYILSGGRDKTIKFWSKTGKLLQSISKSHNNSILDLLQLSQQILLSCSRDNTIKIWNFNKKFHNFSLIQTFKAHDSTILSLQKLTGQIFISSSADTKIKIFQISKPLFLSQYSQYPILISQLEGHTNWVYNVKKITQKMLVSCSEDKSIRIWDWEKSKQLGKIEHSCGVMSIDIGEVGYGKPIFFGDLQGKIGYVQVGKNQEMNQNLSIKILKKGHEALIRNIKVEKNQLISMGQDCWVRKWRIIFKNHNIGNIDLQLQLEYEYRHEDFATDALIIDDKMYSSSYDGKIKMH